MDLTDAGPILIERASPRPAPRSDGSTFRAQQSHTYAALDLGTNNCRLLVARPHQDRARNGSDGLRIVDAFSSIVRLGEGLHQTGELGEVAIARTLEALAVCRTKMDQRGVTRARLIATEACRMAANGEEFLERVREELELELEIIDRETEARLAALGCAALADPQAEGVLIFDIGGGSSELIWFDPAQTQDGSATDRVDIRLWTSLQIGVVSLAEQFGGMDVSPETYDAMVSHVARAVEAFLSRAMGERHCSRFHLLGTSGTVTTVAGVHLNLARYDRRRVDGLWMSAGDVSAAIARLRRMSYAERAAHGCIGPARADLVLAGCAILEAIRRAFPAPRLRIADRGLREGILIELMRADGVWDHHAETVA
ncbi:MAG: Ppx/GppA family phosphatase [Methylobacteriaceae bacterium]|nr:Ppx/GppA family phosphatase [Methylobacteriaceae bacterium]